MENKDLIMSLMVQCGSLATIVWALTQALGKGVPILMPVPQERIALVLGPLLAAGTHWFAPEWIGVGAAEGVKAYVAAGFLGLASTVVAGKAHDWVLGPAIEALAKKGNGTP